MGDLGDFIIYNDTEMRLDAWILGSAACLMAGAAKASSSNGELLRRSGSQANTRIRFEPFTKPNIFTSEVTIPWTVADNTLTVMTAQLRLMNNNKLVAVGERSMNSGRSPAAGDSNQHRNGGRSEDVPAHQRALSDSVFKIPCMHPLSLPLCLSHSLCVCVSGSG